MKLLKKLFHDKKKVMASAFPSNLFSLSCKWSNRFKPTPTVLFQREVNGTSLGTLNQSLIGHRVAYSQSLYKRDLLGHYGCVNAIEFSNDGHHIASGELL